MTPSKTGQREREREFRSPAMQPANAIAFTYSAFETLYYLRLENSMNERAFIIINDTLIPSEPKVMMHLRRRNLPCTLLGNYVC